MTQRELEILDLLASGASNRQIAKELVLALGTVKTHIHNVYGKLSVTNRVQAVARAKELRLLEPNR
jgi:ATP/maltotriose-dependent transcriptional regulator MalT